MRNTVVVLPATVVAGALIVIAALAIERRSLKNQLAVEQRKRK